MTVLGAHAYGSGMTKLDQYIKEQGETAGALAKRLGISAQHVSFLRRGMRIPSLPLARKIEAATKGYVGLDDWPETAAREESDA